LHYHVRVQALSIVDGCLRKASPVLGIFNYLENSMETETLVTGDGLVKVAPDAVELTGMSKSWLYAAMERGDLAYVKLGRSRRIPRAALRDLMARNLYPSATTGEVAQCVQPPRKGNGAKNQVKPMQRASA
jgi:excisionase family DNA binding protein